MPLKTLERIRQAAAEAEATAHEAIATAPIGFIADSLHKALSRRQHSMNVAVIGSFSTDYVDPEEAAAVSKSVVTSLVGTVLKDADVLVIETLNFLDGPNERENWATAVTAKNLSRATQERLEGVVTTGSIDVIGSTITPDLMASYLPRAEAKTLKQGLTSDPSIAYLAVASAARLGEGFGMSPTQGRDGGISQLVGPNNSWQPISEGGLLGLHRQGML